LAQTNEEKTSTYLASWQDEVDSAALYRALSEAENNPGLVQVYARLAEVEEEHAAFWEEKLKEAGLAVLPRKVGWRSRTLAMLARRFGPQFVIPTVSSMERADSHTYAVQEETRGIPLSSQEYSHARLLQSIAGPDSKGLEGGTLARLEGRHRATSGNSLRAAVLGANDGLLSNFSLVMGVAGTALSAQTILITGLAGLLAGAGSMAMGEWISVQSSRELY
jgi:VIT1/CCC1 family predicted Fe2+/Mn2+ transporter